MQLATVYSGLSAYMRVWDNSSFVVCPPSKASSPYTHLASRHHPPTLAYEQSALLGVDDAVIVRFSSELPKELKAHTISYSYVLHTNTRYNI